MTAMRTNKQFLGDGVFASWDGFHIVLTAENGVVTTDTIYLDGPTFRSLTHRLYDNPMVKSARVLQRTRKMQPFIQNCAATVGRRGAPQADTSAAGT